MTETWPRLVRGRRFHAEPLYRAIDELFCTRWPGLPLYPALFGCSDEVNAETAGFRSVVLGRHGGFFTTRMIGSQVFFHQIQVALAEGHGSNVFEVNAHVGEVEEGGVRRYGTLLGRDGAPRATCGALAHVLHDLRHRADEPPSVSQVVDGEIYLDFLGTLRFRLQPHRAEILAAPDPVLAITHTNLLVQVRELRRQLERSLRQGRARPPLFVIGSISFNHAGYLDEETLEHFIVLHGPDEAEAVDLLGDGLP
jgi:hypothetical protein